MRHLSEVSSPVFRSISAQILQSDAPAAASTYVTVSGKEDPGH